MCTWHGAGAIVGIVHQINSQRYDSICGVGVLQRKTGGLRGLGAFGLMYKFPSTPTSVVADILIRIVSRHGVV